MGGDDTQLTARLPAFLRPGYCPELVRIGRDHDGGYLIDARNLAHADLLIGMGINDDWSFEEQFSSRCDVPLHAYDGSVSAWDLFVALYTRVVLFEPANARHAWRHFQSFRRFFDQKTRRFHCEFIGNNSDARFVALRTVIERDVAAEFQNIFFKIDIERAEYQIFDTLIEMADRIEGLVIELHDIDRHMTRIRDFIKAMPLSLCHVHVNNFPGLHENGTPLVIECSFTRRPVRQDQEVKLPHVLDMPCSARRADFSVTFAD